MNSAFLLTGSNMGDRLALLANTREWLERDCGRISAISAVYETAAWGKEDQAPFLNQALQLETELGPRQLLRHVLRIEKKMGRLREERFGPRIIDIDILLYNQEIHAYPLLKLPHPELPNRRFALTPLSEIAPNLEHPLLHQTITQLLSNCPDPLPVSIYPH